VAELIVYLASDRAAFITGSIVSIDGRFLAGKAVWNRLKRAVQHRRPATGRKGRVEQGAWKSASRRDPNVRNWRDADWASE